MYDRCILLLNSAKKQMHEGTQSRGAGMQIQRPTNQAGTSMRRRDKSEIDNQLQKRH